LHSVRSRIAADNAKYKITPGDATALAKEAAKAERQAAACMAQEKVLQCEQKFTTAREKAKAAPPGKEKATADLAKADQQLAAAKQAFEAAEKARHVDSTQYSPLSPVYPTKSTGRRRALARWIASHDNPLTARVAVNHIWMRHFDRALVDTVFDFGRNGKKPSHPELLDWLAVELMVQSFPAPSTGGIPEGWNMKHVHRLIVTSNTYKMQSTEGDPKSSNHATDADNRWLWHYPRHRKEAEVVRDSILSVSGELDGRIGGPPLENDPESTSRRRGLYFSVYPEDGGHLKFLEIFDAPDACDCYRRTSSIVPQQALVMTNSRFVLTQSRLLARKVWADVNQAKPGGRMLEPAFVTAAFEQILCRQPSPQEQAACLEFLAKQTEIVRSTKPLPTEDGAGPIAPSPDPQMRARESLIRALFSHDDFVTMR